MANTTVQIQRTIPSTDSLISHNPHVHCQLWLPACLACLAIHVSLSSPGGESLAASDGGVRQNCATTARPGVFWRDREGVSGVIDASQPALFCHQGVQLEDM